VDDTAYIDNQVYRDENDGMVREVDDAVTIENITQDQRELDALMLLESIDFGAEIDNLDFGEVLDFDDEEEATTLGQNKKEMESRVTVSRLRMKHTPVMVIAGYLNTISLEKMTNAIEVLLETYSNRAVLLACLLGTGCYS